MYSFSNFELVHCSLSGSNCCFLTCIQVSQVMGSGLISFRIFQFVVIHTVKDFSVVNEAEVDLFIWNPLAFSVIQEILAIWCLVPLPFLNPAVHLEVLWNMVRYIIILKFSIVQFLKGHQYWGLSPLLICRHQRWQERSYSGCSIPWVLLSGSAIYARPTFLPRYYPL